MSAPSEPKDCDVPGLPPIGAKLLLGRATYESRGYGDNRAVLRSSTGTDELGPTAWLGSRYGWKVIDQQEDEA